MGDESLIADIARLLPERIASADAIALSPCAGGGNNRVYTFDLNGRKLVAKWYFSHPADNRDRLGAEYAFLSYAQRAGVDCVPRPVARDPQRNLAIYECVPGRRMTRAQVGAAEVAQAVDFFIMLNRPELGELARSLPEASEACFSVAEHFRLVDRRLSRLNAVPSERALDVDARAFIARLGGTWRALKDSIARQLDSAAESAEAKVVARCISPSDFGFHNALMDDDGRLRFIDFEYAGWDDPAKMADDFFCQPAVPVPMTHYESFLEAAMRFSVHAHALAARARLLLPIFKVKWCCIMLNDFLPDAARRRSFANPTTNPEQRKRDQLDQAQRLLDSIEVN